MSSAKSSGSTPILVKSLRTTAICYDYSDRPLLRRAAERIEELEKERDELLARSETAKPINTFGAPITVTSTEPQADPTLEPSSSDKPRSDTEVPLCADHADAWFCGRNHLVSGHDTCVVCCFWATFQREHSRVTNTRNMDLADKIRLAERIAKGCAPTDTPKQIAMYAIDIIGTLSSSANVGALVKREDVVYLITHQRTALLEAAEKEAPHHAAVLRDMAGWWQELCNAVKKLKDHALPFSATSGGKPE